MIDGYNLSESQAAELANLVTSGLANICANNMIALAKIRLTKTRKAFVDGVRVFEVSKYQSGVELIGFLPNAVTFGMDAFDMKLGFGKSIKRKQKKNGGWYLTIPFRYANPNAVASSTVFSGVMPPAVYNVAKLLKSGGRGLSKSALPSGFDEAKVRPAVEVAGTVIPEYVHKAPQFQGLQKGGKSNNSQYNVFRRVSDKSDPNSWIHSGIVPKNIHIDALSQMDIRKETSVIVDRYLDQIFSNGNK